MSSVRLFVAADPPTAVREELARWGRGALRGPGLRVLDPSLLHITLCFLGSRPAADIDPIAATLERCVTPGPIALEVGAPLWLPPRRPRVLAVEIHDLEGALGELQGVLAEQLDHTPEPRRFRPHVTVARMRPEAAPPRRELGSTPPLRFEPESVTLYRSQLNPGGAQYIALTALNL